MQSDGSYRSLRPVVHGDIVLSINTKYKYNLDFTHESSLEVFQII